MRLQYQIILATFLPLIVFGLLSGGTGVYAVRRLLEGVVLERQEALAQVAAAGVAGNLRGHVRLLETTADELAEYTGDPLRQQQILSERARALSIFSGGVGLLDSQGVAIATTPEAQSWLGLSFANREYFQEVLATQAPTFSTVFTDRPTGQAAIVIVVPARRDGAFVGALLGEFKLNRSDWARDLQLLRTPQGRNAYLIDRASTIIYHPDPRRVGSSIQSDPELWRLVIAGKPKSRLYQPANSSELVVVAYAPIPGIAWGLIMEEPWQAILASIVPYQWAVIGLMALGMALALVALVLSVNRVTRPLNALVAEGQRMAQGRPFRSLSIKAPPDLNALIQVINEMVTNLAQQQVTLRQYALQILRGQEDERLRISRELHDETVQDLVALTQRIELCSDALEEDPVAARARLQEVRDLAYNTLAEVRRISSNLRPFILEDLGLPAALQVLTRELDLELPGTQTSCEIVGKAVRLPPELELTAFRIAQEALSNVRKHATTATRVNVALVFEDWGITMLVEDNGPGFDVADPQLLARNGHLGLAGMVERAQLFGGDLRIVSAPDEGTTVALRLPWTSGGSNDA